MKYPTPLYEHVYSVWEDDGNVPPERPEDWEVNIQTPSDNEDFELMLTYPPEELEKLGLRFWGTHEFHRQQTKEYLIGCHQYNMPVEMPIVRSFFNEPEVESLKQEIWLLPVEWFDHIPEDYPVINADAMEFPFQKVENLKELYLESL